MYLLNEYLLDGSGSIDSDKNILQYNRKHLSGPSDVEIDRYEKSKASASGLVKSGNYKFELIVTDADQLSSKDTVVVTIAEPECTTITGKACLKICFGIISG